jgi:predicted nucleotidyltransferase component of viral defense system
MKDEALALIENLTDPSKKLNLLREYLQAQVLRSLHESEAFVNLSFVGGTALRFLFNLPRFSEDLDFSLDSEDAYMPTVWFKKVKTDLSLAGFDVSLTWNDRTTVHKVWIKIPGLLKEAGLAEMQSQNLSIKLEIDTRPPSGALSKRKVISRHALLAIKHYDLSSLMAGKLHALMTRKYAKGRDWYDLLWYMTQQPPVCPNLVQLQNALDQTQGTNRYAAKSWSKLVLDTIKHIDVSVLQADVQPFLERPNEASLLSVETFESLLS